MASLVTEHEMFDKNQAVGLQNGTMARKRTLLASPHSDFGDNVLLLSGKRDKMFK